MKYRIFYLVLNLTIYLSIMLGIGYCTAWLTGSLENLQGRAWWYALTSQTLQLIAFMHLIAITRSIWLASAGGYNGKG